VAEFRERARDLCWLDVIVPRSGAGARYPEEAPLVLVRQASMEPEQRRVVNSALAKEAARHAGQEAVYALLCWLKTELPFLLEQRLDERLSDAQREAEEREREAELLAAQPKRKQWANRLLSQVRVGAGGSTVQLLRS
jgi:hypothetical protein